MEKGVILKGIGGFYYVKTRLGIIECRARGKFRNSNIKPCVGDYVDIEVFDDNTGAVSNIYDRKNVFVRPPVANIDTLVIVASVKNPEPDFTFIDKIAVTASVYGVDLIICFNKTDLGYNENEIKKIYENTPYKIFFINTIDNGGIDDLKKELSGKIVAFAGFSGVGKSSILSVITEKTLETGEVSTKLKRGKHTTRHVELIEYNDDSYIADTPGFSMLELPKIDAGSLELHFPEFSEYIDNCRFNGCSHLSERDCAVKQALNEGKISQKRYENYVSFYNKLNSIKEW